MRRFIVFVLLLAALVAGGLFFFGKPRAPVPLQLSPELRIHQGAIVGGIDAANPAIHVYNGIPFAAAKRWQAPGPAPQWGAEARDVRAFGAECVQPRGGMSSFTDSIVEGLGMPGWQEFIAKRYLASLPSPPESEDCLFLNVRTGNAGGKKLQPVMVWIHGGSHQYGAGSQGFYQSNGLVARNVVLVTINYRLGPFGYLAHPALSEEAGVSGNYGLLDQIAALKWVQQNISVFGGDPQNVTVFGESAGAQSISELMASPLADGLYHKVILESGSSSYNAIHLKEAPIAAVKSAEAAGAEFLSGLAPEGADAAALRAIPAEAIVAQMAAKPELGGYWLPNVDGKILPRPIGAALRDGEAPAVPMISGYNADEASLYYAEVQSPTVLSGGPITGTLAERQATLRTVFGENIAAALIALYGLDTEEGWHSGSEDMLGDDIFGVHMRFIAKANAKAGAPTWMYMFAQTPPSPKQTIGAYHSSEIPYVFDSHPGVVKLGEDEKELTSRMGAYWTNFAYTGNPNGKDLPAWPAYSVASDSWIELDTTPQAVDNLRAQKLDALEANLLLRLQQLSPPAPPPSLEALPVVSGGQENVANPG